jgi:hypothetical protein
MKNLVFFLLFFLPFISSAQHTPEKLLYPMVVGQKWGYIDASGKTIIEPQFFSAGDFFEGLAPVRQDGYYGFIDTDGKFRIPAVYDYARTFQGDLAEVWIKGKKSYINRKGQQPFAAYYVKTDGFRQDDNFAIVTTGSGKVGLLHRDGKLILDTIYDNIKDLREGMYWVSRNLKTQQTFSFYDPLADSVITYKSSNYTALADTNGIVREGIQRFNLYNKAYSGGYALVNLDWSHNSRAIIDRKGNMVYRFLQEAIPWRFPSYIVDFTDGLTPIEYFGMTFKQRTEKGALEGSIKKGWLTVKGELVLPDTMVNQVTAFRNGTALGQIGEQWFLFDRQGQRLSDTSYNVANNSASQMTERWIYANQEGAWVVVDTLGRAVKKFPGRLGHSLRFQQAGRYLFVHHSGSCHIWDALRQTCITREVFNETDTQNGFRQGILKVVTNKNELAYIDTLGFIIWKENLAYSATSHQKLNIDHLWPNGFLPKPNHSNQLLRVDYGTFERLPYMVESDDSSHGVLHLQIHTNVKDANKEKYANLPMDLTNQTPDTLVFGNFGPNGRITLHIEALDAEHKWRSIQGYNPGPYCMSGSTELLLLPGEQWTFTVPVFDGAIPTKLRVTGYSRSLSNGKVWKTVSNEIPVRINPGQFWRYEDMQRINPKENPFISNQ